MAWFSKAFGGKIESHKQKFGAVVRCNFARGGDGEDIEALGIYKRDPRKHPGEPNLLPDMIAKMKSKKLAAGIKAIVKKGKRT